MSAVLSAIRWRAASYVLARPVNIGKDCWFGANVVVSAQASTSGDNCVIGAAAWSRAIFRPIPFAAGNPCRVIRELTEADSMAHKPAILADNQIIPADEQI